MHSSRSDIKPSSEGFIIFSKGFLMTYYIDWVYDLEDYASELPNVSLLRNATADDYVIISIDSTGGVTSLINYLACSVRASKATIIVVYYGTFISLFPILTAADIVVEAPNAVTYCTENAIPTGVKINKKKPNTHYNGVCEVDPSYFRSTFNPISYDNYLLTYNHIL